jgi:hypothetical protein
MSKDKPEDLLERKSRMLRIIGDEEKTLDGKFAIRGNRLVKVSSGEPIPEDEPVFIMRGRDHLALEALRYYRQLSVADNCNDYHFGLLDAQIEKFRAFAREHPEMMKQPSVTRGLPFTPPAPSAKGVEVRGTHGNYPRCRCGHSSLAHATTQDRPCCHKCGCMRFQPAEEPKP